LYHRYQNVNIGPSELSNKILLPTFVTRLEILVAFTYKRNNIEYRWRQRQRRMQWDTIWLVLSLFYHFYNISGLHLGPKLRWHYLRWVIKGV